MEEIIKSLPFHKKQIPIFTVVIVAAVALAIGSLITFYAVTNTKTEKEPEVLETENLSFLDTEMSANEASSFFEGEHAFVTAEIIDVTDQFITLRNRAGQFNAFSVSPQLLISKPSNNNRVATSAGQLKEIEKGKWATVNFRKTNQAYEVVSILYSRN